MKREPQYGRTVTNKQVADTPPLNAMKFAICNETFGNRSFADTFSTIRKLGYTGVEIAPFTLAPHNEPFDLTHVSAQKIVDMRMLAEDNGLEIIGVHWVLAKTEGYHLTSPDPTVRRR